MGFRAVASRAVAAGLIAVLCAGPLAGCSSEGTTCTLDSCTVTFDRGVEAKASVLGVGVELVEVVNDQVIVNVNGLRLTLPTGGSPVQAAGLNVNVQQVTDSQVVLVLSKS